MATQRLLAARKVAAVLGPLRHPTRLLIVCSLLEREHRPGELLDMLGTTKGNISQHLRVLQGRKLIASRKSAKSVYYRIADKRLHDLIRTIQKLYCAGMNLGHEGN